MIAQNSFDSNIVAGDIESEIRSMDYNQLLDSKPPKEDKKELISLQRNTQSPSQNKLLGDISLLSQLSIVQKAIAGILASQQSQL